MSEGRWVPLSKDAMPYPPGTRLRVTYEFTVGVSYPDLNNITPTVSEVWEPAEVLVPREWYRDARGLICQYRPEESFSRRPKTDADYCPWMRAGDGGPAPDVCMIRPLSIARWEPVTP